MFYDQALIRVVAGKGGNGAVSFRRESMVPRGGPDGGNGGRGGDVIIVVNRHLNTLLSFQHHRLYEAPDGKGGKGKNQTGRSGKDLFVPVPPGTVVREVGTNAVLCDLTKTDQQFIVARGGRGGRGNTVYANASNQAPQMAEIGSAGEVFEITLELKLIADIGIVGLPNAGKSTLLSVLTAARPKIADYPFTTLQPNLGVALLDSSRTVVLADIPGLIEGASQGVGLGHEFLRHIERTRVLIHVLDGMSADLFEDYATIQKELEAFGHGLETKPQVLAINKMDLPDALAAFDLYVHHENAPAEFADSLPISAVSGLNVRTLIGRATQLLDSLPPVEIQEPTIELLSDIDLDPHEIIREGGGFRIIDAKLVKRVETTRWDLEEAVQRFQHMLERSGLTAALNRAGIKPGDTVYIGDFELEWGE